MYYLRVLHSFFCLNFISNNLLLVFENKLALDFFFLHIIQINKQFPKHRIHELHGKIELMGSVDLTTTLIRC